MTAAPVQSALAAAEVLPPPQSLSHDAFEIIVRRLADDLAFGSDASLFVGSGLEYASSRPYEAGDSIRSIDWRLTARTGRAYVRQYESLKRTNVCIIVDTSASMGVASVPRSKHDTAVWIASALGLIAQRRLSPVAVFGAGERAARSVPSLSRSDLWSAIDPLRSPSLVERTRLADAITSTTMRVPRRSVIIVLSDLHEPNAIDAIRSACQKHEVMVLHIQDPVEVTPLRAGFIRLREAETGSIFLAPRRKPLDSGHDTQTQLHRCGADYLHIRTDRPFIAALRRFLASRSGATRGRG